MRLVVGHTDRTTAEGLANRTRGAGPSRATCGGDASGGEQTKGVNAIDPNSMNGAILPVGMNDVWTAINQAGGTVSANRGGAESLVVGDERVGEAETAA